MGKKRGVRAEIIADSPDSPSKSCKRSRELRAKSLQTADTVAQHVVVDQLQHVPLTLSKAEISGCGWSRFGGWRWEVGESPN